MFARNVSIHLKPHSSVAFTKQIENETIPTLREVMKTLSKFVEGTPKVQTYEVANSTFHKIAAAVAA